MQETYRMKGPVPPTQEMEAGSVGRSVNIRRQAVCLRTTLDKSSAAGQHDSGISREGLVHGC